MPDERAIVLAALRGRSRTAYDPLGGMAESIGAGVLPDDLGVEEAARRLLAAAGYGLLQAGYGFGPDGVSARVLDVTRNVVRLQTGYLYHYAFAMLIGAAAFITYFMFAVR